MIDAAGRERTGVNFASYDYLGLSTHTEVRAAAIARLLTGREDLGEAADDQITASSAGDALQALEHSLPDALVSDLGMPEHDGYDLIGHIRQRSPERGGSIPAVALTAYARVEDRVRALAAGFQIYVPKPVDPGELVAVVARLTHPHRSVSRPSQLVTPRAS